MIALSMFWSASGRGQETAKPAQNWPEALEDDFTVHDFHFKSGETFPEVRIHFYKLGKAVKDS